MPVDISTVPYENVDTQFNNIYKKILPLFGHEGITTSSELQRIGSRLFGSRLHSDCNRWLGVYAQNCLPLQHFQSGRRYAIVNTDNKRDSSGNLNKGTHWIAVASFKSKIETKVDNSVMIFDSFGRPTKKLLKHLYKSLKNDNIIFKDTEYDAEQKWITENCGQLCMTWLKFFDLYGPEKAKWI